MPHEPPRRPLLGQGGAHHTGCQGRGSRTAPRPDAPQVRGFRRRARGFAACHPSFERDGPSFERGGPSFERGGPSFERGGPSFGDDAAR